MKEIIIIAGPNGAGKTSFARQHVFGTDRDIAFINADEIARELAEACQPQWRRDIEAARVMVRRMETLAKSGQDFALETTLSALTYLAKIKKWQEDGYRVVLIFLRLPSDDHAVERVRRRVASGGHGIPEETIRRRFNQGIEYLETHYKSVVDAWYVFNSIEGDYVLSETSGAAWKNLKS